MSMTVRRYRTLVPTSSARSACSVVRDPETPGDWMVPIASIPSVTVVPVTRSNARRTSASGPAGIANRYTVAAGLAWPFGAAANSRAEADPGEQTADRRGGDDGADRHPC